MKHTIHIIVIELLCSFCAIAQNRLSARDKNSVITTPFSAEAEISITLPITQEEIIYNARIYSYPAPGDTLSPANFLIETTDSIGNQSFFAYYDGNYFTYSGNKFREYHYKQDPAPFKSRNIKGKSVPGVHKSGPFSFLIPALLQEQLTQLSTNGNNTIHFTPDTAIWGRECSFLSAEERINGTVAREIEYITEPQGGFPILYKMVSSPATTGEQTVEARFKHLDDSITINEKTLISRYPDIFATMRTSNFTANSLTGKKMQPFSLPSLSGDRYFWKGTADTSMLFIFLNAEEGVTIPAVQAITAGLEEAPFTITPIWIFTDKNPEETTLDSNDTILYNARRLATQLGISGTPTLILTDKTGTIQHIITGYTPALKSAIIQLPLRP